MLSSVEVVSSPVRNDRSGGRKRRVAIDAVLLGAHIRTRVEARKLASGISTRVVAARGGGSSAQGREVRPGNASAASENASEISFTGKEEDVQVGLVYFGKRFLSPALNRWVSPDPLAVHDVGKADLNFYAYVSGQVFVAVDPFGLDGEPTAVPFGPKGADAGTKFVFGGGPDRMVPQSEYNGEAAGKREFIYDPNAQLPNDINLDKIDPRAAGQALGNLLKQAMRSGDCSGPACGTG